LRLSEEIHQIKLLSPSSKFQNSKLTSIVTAIKELQAFWLTERLNFAVSVAVLAQVEHVQVVSVGMLMTLLPIYAIDVDKTVLPAAAVTTSYVISAFLDHISPTQPVFPAIEAAPAAMVPPQAVFLASLVKPM
jgi:hypothetical protein